MGGFCWWRDIVIVGGYISPAYAGCEWCMSVVFGTSCGEADSTIHLKRIKVAVVDRGKD